MTAPTPATNATPSATPSAPAMGRCPVDHRSFAQAATPGGCPVSANAAAFNPFEPAYMQAPAEYLRWAREQEPVFFSPQLGYWVVTRYEDVKAVFRDNLLFSPSIALEKNHPGHARGDVHPAALRLCDEPHHGQRGRA